MRRNSTNQIDTTDMTIIQELTRDGRMPFKHLAAKAGINEHATRDRLDRMIGEGIIKVVAVPAARLTRSMVEGLVGLNVRPGYSMQTIAERLTAYQSFPLVALASGPYNIVTWTSFASLDHLTAFLRHEMGSITGVESTETLIHRETIKKVLSYPVCESGPNSGIAMRQHEVQQTPRIDKLDIALIEELQKDGRMTVLELAKNLDVSRSSATKRLQRLLSEGIIGIVAITAPRSFGYQLTAMIGIKVFPGTVDDVAWKLASCSVVHFVAIALGRYDILLGVHFKELNGLSDFIGNALSEISGITAAESMIYLEIIKSPFGIYDTNHQLERCPTHD